MGHVTRFTPHAQRDMLKIPRADAIRILHRLAEFQQALDSGETAAFDIKALRGRADQWRLRVGDYRVVYTVEQGRLIVWVLAAGNRREVYRDR
ncbi:type II toxin-antitoxin system RelE/ParE family toxin [Kitasatospora sp. NBC_01287]|uniref:type II toxin-antitoxin system RelE family toxin n=1 Tax=Kitasatospora sp. NBC_01287 TaxID=2903573 RepID=UPI00225AA7B0|nr:type II toxin-antitoxin system RelE/ParE family toxin [Kitasatospora sp. NBC_01287]MCX4748604.1 type II toxin-antitoxin system RelE/ParE family toxin [Kitasatospora sp. NBC_01287]